MKKQIVLLDLFSGTGGFPKGLLQAGFTFRQHYFSEIDKFGIANYQYNFKHAKALGDITKVKGKQLERPDIICFGSPCQNLSLAGDFTGLKGGKSKLFFEAIRIVRECKPDVFVFENVKGLFSCNKGKDFEVILQTIAELGLYECQWQLLDTGWLLPQHRERIYLVGHLRGKGRQQVFPIGQSPAIPQTLSGTREVSREDCASAITTNYSKGVHGRGETYVRALDGIPIPSHNGHHIAREGDGVNLMYLGKARSAKKRVMKGKAYTLQTEGRHYTVNQGKIRRLTPLECERLQGFPDNWTQYGLFDGEVREISDFQRYHMLGNAVSVPVVELVGQRLLGKAVEQPQTTLHLLADRLRELDFSKAA